MLPSLEASAAHRGLLFSTIRFADLGVEPALLEGLASLNFHYATEVQHQCFLPVLEGRDVVVQSKTGSGKTCAFAIPLLQRLPSLPEQKRPRILVLCPTRELAIQVENEISAVGQSKQMRSIVIYGGVGFGKQNDALRQGVDVIVGTPGRIMDQVEQKNLDLSGIEALVLDEADEMLSMGFWDDVMWLIKKLPAKHQTLLFSATLPLPIERAARSFQKDPVRIDLSTELIASDSVTHHSYITDGRIPKPRNLLYVLELERPESAIVFCNTRADVDLIANVLGNQGYDVESLSGALAQGQREKVMNAIKLGKLRFMVATDIAARGIDITDLSHVVNYSLPEDPEVYVHRSGRTGRIGKTGTSVSLVSGGEEGTKSILKRDFGVVFIEKQLPDLNLVSKMRSERIVKELIQLAEQAEVGQQLATAQEIVASDKREQIIAFLLKQYLARTNRPRITDDLAPAKTESAPAPRPKPVENTRPAPRPKSIDRAPPQRVENKVESKDATHRRIFINLGSEDGVAAGTLAAEVATLANVPPETVKEADLRRTSSFIEVDHAQADAVLDLNGTIRNHKTLIVEFAKRKR